MQVFSCSISVLYNFLSERLCADKYLYQEGLCINNNTVKEELLKASFTPEEFRSVAIYYGISAVACKAVCSQIQSQSCGGFFYNRTARLCEITSAILQTVEKRSCPLTSLEYYLRDRCVGKQMFINLVNKLKVYKFKTMTYGKHSIKYVARILWNSINVDIKNTDNVNVFKRRIRTWQGLICQCGKCLICIFKVS